MTPVDTPWLRIDPTSKSVSIDSTHPGFYNDPYASYEKIRSVAPAFYWEEQKLWCFMSAADVSAILRDRRFGRELLPMAGQPVPEPRPAPDHLQTFHAVDRNSMLEREPPVHTRLRTLVNRAFVARNIERLRPRILALAHELVDRMKVSNRAELIGAYATPIPVVVIAELLGVPAGMSDQLVDWSHRMVAVYQLGCTREKEDQAEAATREFSDFLRQYFSERRKRPADDLISHLLNVEATGERLSEDEMIATCILLLNAGHEGTVHSIGNAVKTLLENNSDTAAAFSGEAATEATVEECLRFDPPLHMFNRVAQEDSQVAGIGLKRGTQVGLLYGAANRDPAKYPRADVFDPGRPIQGAAASHASFGGGIHFCLGAPLARLELQISLPVLFERLPGLYLASRPTYRDSYHFHGLTGLEVGWP
ncbi:MAG TPA: cytochrome P450 [Opitutaceae bacterium]|jgi:cytochrome P450|nr:cytochrome P450 [Opitutaceae bacterium]